MLNSNELGAGAPTDYHLDQPLIEIKDIHKIFKTGAGDFTALKEVNVCFYQGEFVSVVGIGASTIAFNKPTMCNGANLFFEKAAFYVHKTRLHPNPTRSEAGPDRGRRPPPRWPSARPGAEKTSDCRKDAVPSF